MISTLTLNERAILERLDTGPVEPADFRRAGEFSAMLRLMDMGYVHSFGGWIYLTGDGRRHLAENIPRK